MASPSGEKLDGLASLRIDRDGLEARRSRRPIARWIVYLLLLAAAIAIGVKAYQRWVAPLGIPEVTVVRAVAESPSRSQALLTATGYVVAQRQAAVTSKITGRLAELAVSEGSRVRAGQVIGRLEDRDYEAALEEARRSLDVAKAAHQEAQAREFEARREYERQRRLLEEGVSSQSDYDGAEARYKVAVAQVQSTAAEIPRVEASVTMAEVTLANTRIVSPFDGVVTTKNGEVGEIVAPVSAGGPASGNSVVLIADMSSLEAEVDINETNIGRLREGQPAEIVLDAYPDRRYPGRLRQIVPTANRQKATVEGKVAFDELAPEVLPEMSVRVTFLERPGSAEPGGRPRVFVPRGVLVTRGATMAVLAVRDGIVEMVPVKLGPEVEGRVEILEGLAGGESLVVDAPESLADGSAVRVKAGN